MSGEPVVIELQTKPDETLRQGKMPKRSKTERERERERERKRERKRDRERERERE